MAGIRIHVVMPPGLVERIDSARGEGQSRGDWVRQAVERALEESGAPGGAVVSTSSPAPAEQPETPDFDRDGGMVPVSAYRPRVPFRRDVKPFQRGES